MSPPKGPPGHVALLQPQDEELRWPEQRPRPVRQVQHAIRLVPAQFDLDVRRQLGLYGERHEAQDEEYAGVHVFLPRGESRIRRGRSRAHRLSAREGGSIRGRGGRSGCPRGVEMGLHCG